MGLGDFIGSVESGVGSFVDSNAHLVGGALDGVGLHSAAHAVDSFGDHIADDLGAQVGEAQLGQSDDPKDLVHGDVKAIGESVGHLRKFASAFGETGIGLQRLESDHWQGQAAEAFRTKFSPHPKQWQTAADACQSAADALDQYSHTVSWAQQQAQQAIDTYKAAKQASDQAREEYDKQVDWYNQETKAWSDYARTGQDPGPAPMAPGAFHNPGSAVFEEAQESLRSARQQRDSAAETAKAAIDAATVTAPAEPSFLSRMEHDVSDVFTGSTVGQLHLAGGVVKGAVDIVNFGRGLNPMDPYNLLHPAQYADHASSTAAGLLHAANHPTELLSAVVGSGWGSDPFEAVGKLTTNIAFGVATGGAGEAGAVTEDIAVNASENLAENAGRDTAENAARDAADNARWSNLRDFYNAPKGEWADLARPSDGVESSAVHAGSVDPATAQKFLDDQYPWMRDVNRPRFEAGLEGYNQNCSENVIAVNQRLDGIDAIADPLENPRWPDPAKLGDPNASWDDAHSYDNIVQDMKARGEGSRGVVYISRLDGTAHVFNVINDANGVVFLDGQTGTLGHLESNVTSIKYMPYR